MSILFAGTEFDAFEYQGNGSIYTTAGLFDPTFVRNAFSFPPTTLSRGIPWTPTSETWLHFENYGLASNATTMWIGLIDANGDPIVRLRVDAANSGILEYFDGSVWTTVYSLVISASELVTFDIRYRNTVDGAIAIYLRSFLLAEVFGDFSGLAPVSNFGCVARATNSFRLSQIIVADEPTIGFKLAYRQPTGDGFHTAWGGDFSNVNATVPSDSSFISTDTINATETFTRGAFTVPNGYSIKAVSAQALIRRGSTGPQNAAFLLRFGSTDHVGVDKPLQLGLKPVQQFWPLNPATGLPWVPADAASTTVEFGLRAKA